MESINTVFGLIQSLGIIITLIISIKTIKQETLNVRKSIKSDLLTKRRSERMDRLQQLYSSILAEGELKLLGQEVNTSKLVYATNHYCALLQYIYQYADDIELINMAHLVERTIVSDDCNKEELKDLLNNFYFKNDQYMAIELLRLSNEISTDTNEYETISSQEEAAKVQKTKIEGNYRKVKQKGDVLFM